MVVLDSIRIDVNPDIRYSEEIISEIIRTDDWNRTKKEVQVWAKTHDVFEFYVAIDNETDQAVGSIGLTMDKAANGNPADDLYYIGDFYTREEYRGIGLGIKLFNMVLERTKGFNVNLNAVPSAVAMYDKKFGFSFYPEYFHLKAKLDTVNIKAKSGIDCLDYTIVDLIDANWDALITYDRAICARERSRYLKEWAGDVYALTKVALDSKGTVVGLACTREQKQNRLYLGPFYADNKEIAEILLHKVLSRPDLTRFEQVWLRFPETNKACISILDSLMNGDYDLHKSTKSQFNKRLITPDAKKIFSVFESGHSYV